jgi:hypothetical protein
MRFASGGRTCDAETKPFVIQQTETERAEPEARCKESTSSYRDVVRAKIVLLASQGLGNDRIAAQLGLPRQIASKWRQRFCLRRVPRRCAATTSAAWQASSAPAVAIAAGASVCLTTCASSPKASHCNDRLRVSSLEQLHDLFDRNPIGLVLIGMPGMEKRLAHYPQLYSRVGFVHAFRPLHANEIRQLLAAHCHEMGLALPADGASDPDCIAAIICIAAGNFRLIHRLRSQVLVIDAAREGSVIGAA